MRRYRKLKMVNRDKIFFALIILIILLGIYVVFYIKSESFKCMSNSASYTIKNLEKSNDGNISCSCSLYQDYQKPIFFGINNSGIISTNYLNNQYP